MLELKEKIRTLLHERIPFEADSNDLLQILHLVMWKYARHDAVLVSVEELQAFEADIEGCTAYKFELGVTTSDYLGVRMVPCGRSLS